MERNFHDQEAAIRAPRFRIAWLMAVVAVVALNFGAMRGWSTEQSTEEPEVETNQALILGGLPMANVLAVGLLVSWSILHN